MQKTEEQWQTFIIDRLIQIETRVIQNQCLLTAMLNILPKDDRKKLIQEYKDAVKATNLLYKELPEGIKFPYI